MAKISLTAAAAAVMTMMAAGLRFFPKTSVAALVFGFLTVLMLCLCKAAAMGNVYCPSCQSEEHTIMLHYGHSKAQHHKIIRTCKDCGHVW